MYTNHSTQNNLLIKRGRYYENLNEKQTDYMYDIKI